jgi:diacylglycerol kinase (ATP)
VNHAPKNDRKDDGIDSLKGKQGLARLVSATINSLQGFRQAWQHEAAFREECLLLALFFPLAFWLGQTPGTIALLLVSGLVILIVELLNTAVEAVVDRIGLERHELSGRAKDVASAAVFLSLVQFLLVWGLVAWQRFAMA